MSRKYATLNTAPVYDYNTYWTERRKRMKDSHKSVIVSLERTTKTERKCKSLMITVTQDMKYRQSLICYAKKYGVARASRKYNRPMRPLQYSSPNVFLRSYTFQHV